MRILILLTVFFSFAKLANSQNPITIAEKTKNMKLNEGFMNFYLEERSGKIFLEISKQDSEILYQTSLPSGLGSNDVGLDRGIMGSTYIVKFNRIGNKVLMIVPNYHFRAITDNVAEKIAVEQSFAQSVIWGFAIEAETNGVVLVDATNFLLRDAMNVSLTLKNALQGTYNLDQSRCGLYLKQTKNFPLNTEFESTVTFVNEGKAGNFVSSVTPVEGAITLRTHHSFVKLPDNHYKPRMYDARCPYIPLSFYDYGSPVSEPIEKYYIIRHRLEKKDANLEISEAVKPIVYYLDNGTPEPVKSALLEGASWWNQAFEAAGYKNAFQVKVLPDNADPMDLRYNMINWVHRATRGWSFGNAVIDPRTGEILKGNVTLGSLRVRQDYLIAQGMLSPFSNEILSEDKMLQMSIQRLKQLAAHEVGHTLGLMHNYIASAQNRSSVMDYPSPVISLKNNELDLDHAYTNEIGSWDKVAIIFGYKEFSKSENEKSALDKILKEASEKELTFISDRDARDPAGLHPNAHLWDEGKDAVNGLKNVMMVRNKALSAFGLNTIKKGTPMAMLEDVLVPVFLYHRYQMESVTKVVGGLYYTYSIKGDGQSITTPVPKRAQIEALNALIECLDPKNLLISDSILKLIPPRPAGYEYTRELFHRRTGLVFDPLAAAETAADIPLSLLFNISRLNRMAEFGIKNDGLSLQLMLDMLVKAIWEKPALKGFSDLILKQNQQLVLTYLLSGSVNDDASFATKASIINSLNGLKEYINKQMKQNSTNKGYLLLSLDRIKNPEKAKPSLHVTPPPGSPIGSVDIRCLEE